MVVFFRNGIFCRKPKVLFGIKGITKACLCKTCDRFIRIMHALDNSRSVKFMNRLTHLSPIFCRKHQLGFSFTRNFNLYIFIHITIGMTCQCDWFFPVFYTWFDSFYLNRRTKYRSVKHRTNGSVWRFPHFLQIILCHTCCIWRNRRTLYRNTIF